MVVQYKGLSRFDYLYKLLEIIDCMQLDKSKHTTDREKKVLIKFYMLPDHFDKYRFGRVAKDYVKLESKGTDFPLTTQNLNNKIYSLLDKGLLWRDEDGVIYAKKWVDKAIKTLEAALRKGEEYDFKFRFKGE